MTVEQWMRDNLPNKQTISRDAVEILIKLAWNEATQSEIKRIKSSGWQPPKEIIGPYEIDCLDYSPTKKEIIGPYDID